MRRSAAWIADAIEDRADPRLPRLVVALDRRVWKVGPQNALVATSTRPTGESAIVYRIRTPAPPRRYAAGVMPSEVAARSYTRLLDPNPAS